MSIIKKTVVINQMGVDQLNNYIKWQYPTDMEIKPRRTGIEATNNGKWMRQWGTGTARRGTFLWKSLMDIKGAVNSIPSTALTNPRIAVADNGNQQMWTVWESHSMGQEKEMVFYSGQFYYVSEMN